MHINAYKLAKNILHRSERILDSHIYIYIYIYTFIVDILYKVLFKRKEKEYVTLLPILCQILDFVKYSFFLLILRKSLLLHDSVTVLQELLYYLLELSGLFLHCRLKIFGHMNILILIMPLTY